MYGLGGAVLRERVDEVLALISLADRQHGRVDAFSGSMKRRVNIGVALLHHPRVVIMDEPTVGIDPQSRRHIQDAVKFLNGRGMIVLYTTHYMEEAQELSQRIVIKDQGRVIAADKRPLPSPPVRPALTSGAVELHLNTRTSSPPPTPCHLRPRTRRCPRHPVPA